MKICIYYHPSKGPWGGSNSFLQTLGRFFEQQSGIQVTHSLNGNADIVLLNSWSAGTRPMKLEAIRNVKRYGRSQRWMKWFCRGTPTSPRIVHRLDGIGYLYGRTDRSADDLQCSVNKLSDHSIVQSHYSLKLFQQERIALTPSTVIPNGVDARVFHSQGSKKWEASQTLELCAASWSANPRKGHATIAAYSTIPGVRVRFVGNWPNSVSPAKVELIPAIPFQQLGDFYRQSHAFLFPAEGESCPNVVLEAMSCGLPVLYHKSGGTPELASSYGMEIDSVSPDLVLGQVRRSYSELRDRLLLDPLRFSIERTGERYLRLFESLL